MNKISDHDSMHGNNDSWCGPEPTPKKKPVDSQPRHIQVLILAGVLVFQIAILGDLSNPLNDGAYMMFAYIFNGLVAFGIASYAFCQYFEPSNPTQL